MPSVGGSRKAGGGIAQKSSALRMAISQKGYEAVSDFKTGDLFLFGNNVGRITKISQSSLSFARLSPLTGENAEKYTIDRFTGQRLIRVTQGELSKALSLSRTVGGFASPNPLSGLSEAVSKTLRSRR